MFRANMCKSKGIAEEQDKTFQEENNLNELDIIELSDDEDIIPAVKRTWNGKTTTANELFSDEDIPHIIKKKVVKKPIIFGDKLKRRPSGAINSDVGSETEGSDVL